MLDQVPGRGLLKGMGVTFTTMVKTLFAPSKNLATVNYPKEKEAPHPRARGVIALDQEACTVCMLCSRQCPDWCIYIEGHKEEKQPDKPGGRVRVRATLDRFLSGMRGEFDVVDTGLREITLSLHRLPARPAVMVLEPGLLE